MPSGSFVSIEEAKENFTKLNSNGKLNYPHQQYINVITKAWGEAPEIIRIVKRT